MPDQSLQQTTQPPKHSWGKAFMLYLRDPTASLILKFLVFGGSTTLLDDLIPGIGLIDEPLVPVWLLIVGFVVYKVNKYRNFP